MVVVGEEAVVRERRQKRMQRRRRRVTAIGWEAMRRSGETTTALCKLFLLSWSFAAPVMMVLLDGRPARLGRPATNYIRLQWIWHACAQVDKQLPRPNAAGIRLTCSSETADTWNNAGFGAVVDRGSRRAVAKGETAYLVFSPVLTYKRIQGESQ